MSDHRPNPNPIVDNVVTIEECETIRELCDSGMTYVEVAEELDRHSSTIQRHHRGSCRHRDPPKGYGKLPTKEELKSDLRRLADELERMPSMNEWNHWDGAACSSTHIIERFGGWDNALEAAGLPVIAIHAPIAARKAVYRNPTLAQDRPHE